MAKASTHLLYVAWAFVFMGALALIQTVQSFLSSPTPVPNFLMIFIVVGYGLMRRHNLARQFAISCAYVMIVIYVGNLFFIMSGRLNLPPMDWFQTLAYWLMRFLAIAASAYALWALQKKAVRDEFAGKSAAKESKKNQPKEDPKPEADSH